MEIQLVNITNAQAWLKSHAPDVNLAHLDVVYTWPVTSNRNFYYTLDSIAREIGDVAMNKFCCDVNLIIIDSDRVTSSHF